MFNIDRGFTQDTEPKGEHSTQDRPSLAAASDHKSLLTFIGPWMFVMICGCCVLFGYLLGIINTITLNFY